VDTNRLGRGEMIAAVSAIALLLIMFIFSWFGVDFGDDQFGLAETAGDTTANAWVAFSFIDIILFVSILVAIGVAVLSANAQSVNLPVAGSALVAGLGILCVLLILYRIIDPPSEGDIPDGFDISISREIGVFLGLIAAVGIAYGGYLGMKEEGTSFGDQADRLQNRDAGTTTGGAPPPPPSSEGGDPPRAGGGTGSPPPPPADPGGSPPSGPPPRT